MPSVAFLFLLLADLCAARREAHDAEVYLRGAGRVRGARTHLVHLRAQPAEHRHAAQPPRLLALQALQLAAERRGGFCARTSEPSIRARAASSTRGAQR